MLVQGKHKELERKKLFQIVDFFLLIFLFFAMANILTLSFFVALAILGVTFVAGATFNVNSLSKYNVFVKTPQSSEIIQTGGRLIERHVAYLQEAGFKGIMSVVFFPSNDTLYNGVVGNFPSSDYEMTLASNYGIKGRYVAANFTVESAKEVSAIMDSLPRPLYVHCHVSFIFQVLHFFKCLFY